MKDSSKDLCSPLSLSLFLSRRLSRMKSGIIKKESEGEAGKKKTQEDDEAEKREEDAACGKMEGSKKRKRERKTPESQI